MILAKFDAGRPAPATHKVLLTPQLTYARSGKVLGARDVMNTKHASGSVSKTA